VPRVGRLVEVLTSSKEDSTKRLAMSLIGCVFRCAHLPHNQHPTKDKLILVDKVLREPVRVLVSDGSALKTMATLLGATDSGGILDNPLLMITPKGFCNKINMDIFMPVCVAMHLSDSSLDRAREHTAALVEAGWVQAVLHILQDDQLVREQSFSESHALRACLHLLYNMAQINEKVACDKSIAGAVCDLMAKHARGDIQIADEEVFDIMMSILSEFVGYGDRQMERKKIATNVFRIWLFRLDSVKELMALPRDGRRLPTDLSSRSGNQPVGQHVRPPVLLAVGVYDVGLYVRAA